MNERLTIQDLTDLLAAKHSMTKKDAEAFVKEFFLLIEQALGASAQLTGQLHGSQTGMGKGKRTGNL